MAYEQKGQHIPLSWNKAKQEYFAKPFWIKQFPPGSSFTIVEDIPRGKTMRHYIKPNPKDTTKKGFDQNLIKISDGFVEKDLELSDVEASLLFATVPDNVLTSKGCPFVNESGRWRYLSQTTPDMNENMPRSNQIAASMEPAQPALTTIASMIMALHAAIDTNINTGVKNTPETVLKAAELIKPGDGAHLIQAAKDAGWIVEVGGVIRGT